MSILKGIDELVDDWLDVEPKGKPPYYRHKSTAIELSRRTTPIGDARPFLDACYSRIHQNRLTAVNSRCANPLFAAIEILIYGLLFVWSRENQNSLRYDIQKQPVLGANDVTLSVLAPERFFEGMDLTALATVLDRRLAEFGEQHGLVLAFEFYQLGTDIDLMADTKLAIDTIHRIWADKLRPNANSSL